MLSTYIVFNEPNLVGETGPDGQSGIQVLSWSHSFNQPTSPKGGATGTPEQANHSDLSITKYIDAATDDLLKQCWSGRQMGGAVLTSYNTGPDNKPVRYLQITMEKIIVSNVSIGGGTGDIPTETITLSYGSVTYTTYGPNGEPASVSHDLNSQTVS